MFTRNEIIFKLKHRFLSDTTVMYLDISHHIRSRECRTLDDITKREGVVKKQNKQARKRKVHNKRSRGCRTLDDITKREETEIK